MEDIKTINKFILDFEYYDRNSDNWDENLDVIRVACEDNTISTMMEKNSAWEILYHLSPLRQNILEWYPFKDNASILEIGGECGALTGMLASKSCKLISVEKSKQKAEINAYRHSDSVEAYVYVGNYQDMNLEDKFDYITFVENIDNRIDKKILKKIKSNLNKDGKLILAIDNKMSMRNFSGAADMVSGKPYGMFSTNRTMYSKPELESLLQNEGYSVIRFYYPVPDYRLPTVIFSDEHLPHAGELRGTNRAYTGKSYQMFNDDKLLDSVCNDEMFPYFSNSYLIIAELEK